MRENFSRPSGTCSVFPLFPALKRRAILKRPSGAGFSRPPLRGWIMLCFVPPGCWKTSSHSHAEALRHPKSTAAGEGARATRNQATSVRLNGTAKSCASSKQPLSKQSLQNNVGIPSGGRRWNPALHRRRVGTRLCTEPEHAHPFPYSLGIDSTAPRGLRGGRQALRDRRALRDAGHDTTTLSPLSAFASFVRNS